jgi:hypothetical protein
LLKKGNELLKLKGPTTYVKVDSIYYVKMLLEVVGGQIFFSLALSFTWELPSDQYQPVIRAMFQLLRLYSFFTIPIETLVERVAKLTGLSNVASVHDKQCLLISTLLVQAPLIGNGIKIGGWKPIF